MLDIFNSTWNESSLSLTYSSMTSFFTSVASAKTIIWNHVLPIICLLGLLTNSLNVFVFLSKKLKNKIYKFMLTHSIASFSYLTVSIVYFGLVNEGSVLFKLFQLDQTKNPSIKYALKFYELFFMRSLTTILAIFMILIELTISFERLSLFHSGGRKQFPFCFKSSSSQQDSLFQKHTFKLMISIYLLFSLVTQIPFLISMQIGIKYQTGNSTLNNITSVSYKIENSKYSKLKAVELLNLSFTLLRGVVFTVLQLTLNINMLIKFRKQMAFKSNLAKARNSSTTHLLNPLANTNVDMRPSHNYQNINTQKQNSN